MFKRLAAVIIVCFSVTVMLHIPTAQASAPAIMDSIKKGGYILYLRHGEATLGKDQPNVNFLDCSTQRNLSAAGKSQAQLIGNVFTSKMIPVQYPVVSSPYCRARETAEIAFGQQHVAVNPVLGAIANLSQASAEQSQLTLSQLARVLEVPPPPGTNTVIVGHSFPAGQALGEIPDLGTVVIRPNGEGKGYTIIAKMSLEAFTSRGQ